MRLIIGDGRNFLTQASRQVRRHRLRAVEPVDHRRVQPVHRRLLEAGAQRGSPTTASSASGRSSTRCRRRTSRSSCSSFAEVFPYTYVFSAEDLSSDVILVATNHPLAARRARARAAASPTRRCARSSSAAASSRPRTSSPTCCSRPTRSRPSPPARRSTPTTTRIIEFARAARSPRLDAHRRSVPGARLRHRVALRPLRSLPRRPRRGRRALEDRAAPGPLAARARQARRRRSLPRRRQAPRRARRTRAPRAWPSSSARRRPTIARSRSPTPPGRSDGPRRARSAQAAGEGAARLPQGRARGARAAPGRTRSWRCASWPESYIDEGGRDLQLLLGYLMYKADLDDVACDRLKPLVDDSAFARAPPVGATTTWRAPSTATACSKRPCATWTSTSTRRQRLRSSGALTTLSNKRMTNGLSAAATLARRASAPPPWWHSRASSSLPRDASNSAVS